MTNPTPVVQGQPDFNRILATSKIIILHKNEALNAQKNYGITYCGNLPYLQIRLGCTVSARLTIGWFGDQAGSIDLTPDVVVNAIPGQGTAQVTIPVRGPYVRILADLSAYPNTVLIEAIATPSPANRYSGTDGENALISNVNVALGGGANTIINAPVTRQGWATWTADVLGATTFVAYLGVTNFAGVVTFLDYISQVNRAQRRTVYLPALPTRIQVFNLDVGAHDYIAILNHMAFDY